LIKIKTLAVILFFVVFTFCSYSCKVKKNATTSISKSSIWTLLDASKLNQIGDSLPKKFIAYQLDEEALRKAIATDSIGKRKVVSFPTPDSSFTNYSIAETQVMAPALAAKYPLLKSYEGVEVANRLNRLRADFNEQSFHAQFVSLSGEYFISPIGKQELNYYLVFRKEDAPFRKVPFEENKR
jgi:hypothetical protein